MENARPARLDPVDLLRGLVMVVMAIDHTRDYFHFSAIQGIDPTDQARTSPGFLLLAAWDRGTPRLLQPFVVFGRVPFF